MSPEPFSHWQPEQRSSPALAQRLDRLAMRLLPGALTAVGVVLLAAPSGIPGVSALIPGVTMASVFFWSVWRPASMSVGMVFCLGLLLDLIGFAPLGVEAFVFLLLHGIAGHARFGFMRLNFLALWIVFVLLEAGACWLVWFLVSALSFRLMPTAPVIFEGMLAAGLYPPFAAVGTWAHRRLSNPEQHL
ncbi:rod shape-determining protein MreD [Acetobacter conturbans]|uniref:Rod shape-determining protein MreD n=1 Tax=Acetobacter conturbans TaxID=1737472 RepID=A0ABX0JW48_9PROT|nr:rod shape-determining protein MreD [Acetobacter conturbans]NHN87072.1 rod shape-determining protein MreD [Acetobacter conturbans]